MSLDGSVCFFVLYHYESNCFLAMPIAGLNNKSIYNAYVARFKELKEKGFKPQLNVLDNQATKHIFSPRMNASSNWLSLTTTV